MAQDLLAHEAYRHAVILKPCGFYAVNYAMPGLKMTTLAEWRVHGLSAVQLAPARGEADLFREGLAS